MNKILQDFTNEMEFVAEFYSNPEFKNENPYSDMSFPKNDNEKTNIKEI